MKFNLLNGIKLIKSKKSINSTQRTKPTKINEIIIITSEELTIFFLIKNLLEKNKKLRISIKERDLYCL